MTLEAASSPRGLIVVGPSPDCTGGMARVVEQSIALDISEHYAVHLHPMTFAPDERESLTGRVRRHVRHLRRLRSLIRETRASIVHIHACSGFTFWRCTVDLIAARRMGCRTVLHMHGAKFDAFFDSSGGVGRSMIRWVLNRAHRVIALSACWKAQLQRMAPRARIEVIENAVERPPLPSSDRPTGPCRFLLLARMDVWKGVHDLLDACALLRDRGSVFHVTLAGPPGTAGDGRSLRERINGADLADVVRYVGNLDARAKWQALHSANAYVQPSHHEGMPIALLEALACGLPIVATRVGAVGEVLDGSEAGLLTEAHDPLALADAMARLIDDPPLRDVMSTAAGRLAEGRFSIERFRLRHLAMYDDLIRESEPVGRRCRDHDPVIGVSSS